MTDAEGARATLIQETARRAGAAADGPPDGFVEALFGRTALADLAHYSPAGLAALAQGAWTHLSSPHAPGGHDIRLTDHDFGGAGDVTVLEK